MAWRFGGRGLPNGLVRVALGGMRLLLKTLGHVVLGFGGQGSRVGLRCGEYMSCGPSTPSAGPAPLQDVGPGALRKGFRRDWCVQDVLALSSLGSGFKV